MPSFHVVSGEWRLPPLEADRTWLIRLDPLIARTAGKTAVDLPLDEVCHRETYVSDERLEACDPSIPGLVIPGGWNPCGKPYRLIDGNHRVHRLRRAGASHGPFYLFEIRELADCIVDYESYQRGLKSWRQGGAFTDQP